MEEASIDSWVTITAKEYRELCYELGYEKANNNKLLSEWCSFQRRLESANRALEAAGMEQF